MAKGRPSKYKPEFPEQAAKLCKLGATDEALADFFGVTRQTINQWKLDYPDFSYALKTAKDELDSQVVRSLFQRAMGYSHPEDKIFNNNGKELVVPTIKHYPPDPTSMIFWLKNRQRETWRDKPEGDKAEDALTDIADKLASIADKLPD